MIIHYDKGLAIVMGFPKMEFHVVLQILKALHKVNPQDFIKQAIDDVENDMKPKILSFENNHLCEHCKMMMKSGDSNNFLMTTRDLEGKEVSKWIHYQCPQLKNERPD